MGSISPLARIGGLGILSSSSSFASNAPSDDYKAMVVIHLNGGMML